MLVKLKNFSYIALEFKQPAVVNSELKIQQLCFNKLFSIDLNVFNYLCISLIKKYKHKIFNKNLCYSLCYCSYAIMLLHTMFILLMYLNSYAHPCKINLHIIFNADCTVLGTI